MVVVDTVSVFGMNVDHGVNFVTVLLREPRNPIIGDKFRCATPHVSLRTAILTDVSARATARKAR